MLLVFQVGVMVVVESETLREVRGQPALRVKPGDSGGARLLPGTWVPVVCDVQRVHDPGTQEPAGPGPVGHAPRHRLGPSAALDILSFLSIRLTRSSLMSRTGARSDTLARGIRPMILSSRRCSGLRVARAAIAVSASSSMDGNVCSLKYDLGEWGGLMDGLERGMAGRKKKW